MCKPDMLTQNLSPTTHVNSPADGPNLMQDNADARMHAVHDSNIGTPYASFDDKAWQARRSYEKQFIQPGGMTFNRGTGLKDYMVDGYFAKDGE